MWHHVYGGCGGSSICGKNNGVVSKFTGRRIDHCNPKGPSFRIAGIFNGIKIRDIYFMSMLTSLVNGISKIEIRSLPCWDSHRVIAPSLCCFIQPLPLRGKHLISVLNITGVWFPNWAIAHNEIAGLPQLAALPGSARRLIAYFSADVCNIAKHTTTATTLRQPR